MKRIYSLLLAFSMVISLGFISSCGDNDNDDNPIVPAKDTSYMKAKVTGNYNSGINTGTVFYSLIGNNVILLKSQTQKGDIYLNFPKGTSGTFAVDGITGIAEFHESQTTLQVKYIGYSGDITITQSDDKKIKGTFEFNAKTADNDKSVVVKEGEFLYFFE